jgi:cytochrome c-type biogenesis protein CcmF
MVLGVALDLRQRIGSRRRWQDGVAALPSGAWGMACAHLGVAIWTIGVAYTSAFSVEKDARLAPGQSLQLAEYKFILQQASEVQGPNYRAQQATVDVERDDQPVARLHPQKRFYPSQQRVQTESAIDISLLRDLYVALGESYEDGSWSLRVYVKPMMRWVWFGGVLMALGGALALSDPRYRLARAASRREAAVAEAA